MEKIKNIIFDYGNVIFEINFKRTQEALLQLGISNPTEFYGHRNQNPIFDNFEMAGVSSQEFRAEIRKAANNFSLSNEEIDVAWNSLLIGVSANNHDVLLAIKKNYRTFLLSNNNEIHYNWIIKHIKEKYNINNYDDYFEKAYFSQLMKLRKPNVNIFEQVIKENNLNPDETLFIDDSPQHIEGAKKAGLKTLLMDFHPEQLEAFLKHHKLL